MTKNLPKAQRTQSTLLRVSFQLQWTRIIW